MIKVPAVRAQQTVVLIVLVEGKRTTAQSSQKAGGNMRLRLQQV